MRIPNHASKRVGESLVQSTFLASRASEQANEPASKQTSATRKSHLTLPYSSVFINYLPVSIKEQGQSSADCLPYLTFTLISPLQHLPEPLSAPLIDPTLLLIFFWSSLLYPLRFCVMRQDTWYLRENRDVCNGLERADRRYANMRNIQNIFTCAYFLDYEQYT